MIRVLFMGFMFCPTLASVAELIRFPVAVVKNSIAAAAFNVVTLATSMIASTPSSAASRPFRVMSSPPLGTAEDYRLMPCISCGFDGGSSDNTGSSYDRDLHWLSHTPSLAELVKGVESVEGVDLIEEMQPSRS